jgi:hypothetical protein
VAETHPPAVTSSRLARFARLAASARLARLVRPWFPASRPLAPRRAALLTLLTLLFLAAWALLNVAFNLRAPSPLEEPPGWYLLPSIDATLLLAIFALIGGLGRRLPLAVTVVLAAFVVFVRLYRVADGLIWQTYFRPVDLALDVPLLPELWRLLWATVPGGKLALGVLAVLVGLTAAVALATLALLHAQRFLAGGGAQRVLFVVVAAVLVPLYALWPAQHHPLLHRGLYGQSVIPALVAQVKKAASASRHRMLKAAEIQAMQRELAQLPAGLEHLGRADVLFLLVESYGATVLRNPEYFARVRPTLESFVTTLGPAGYAIASSTVESCTYGGHSWLAHATLASGVNIGDARDFAIVRQSELGNTMASLFERAGYRSVVVQPGTTRRFPEGEVRGFSGKYYAMDMDYQGPAFSWAPMSDQYVLDFIHRKEVVPARQPLFVQYALVSSHAPWSEQPPLVDDWNDLTQGRIYKQIEPRRYPVDWATMVLARDAYVDSILYDLEVIRRYIGQQLTRPTLVVVMGDHQPAVLAQPDASHTVPVHLISKDRTVIDRFLAAGYVPGMIPDASGKGRGMDTFPVTLIQTLSRRK